MFHWYSENDRKRQILKYFHESYHLAKHEIEQSFEQGMNAIHTFRKTMLGEGLKIIDQCKKDGTFAVVLAGRAYHTDALVSHDLSRVFTKQYIPVLTVDSLPHLNDVNLRFTRAEVTNNFHTRMLAEPYLRARNYEEGERGIPRRSDSSA